MSVGAGYPDSNALLLSSLPDDFLPEGEDDIWPEEVEKAFLEAYEMFPPCGRSKIKGPNGKLFGRNELISRYIYEKTGKLRSRKQISSHIQVLVKKHQRIHALMYGYDTPYSPPQSLRQVSSMTCRPIHPPVQYHHGGGSAGMHGYGHGGGGLVGVTMQPAGRSVRTSRSGSDMSLHSGASSSGPSRSGLSSMDASAMTGSSPILQQSRRAMFVSPIMTQVKQQQHHHPIPSVHHQTHPQSTIPQTMFRQTMMAPGMRQPQRHGTVLPPAIHLRTYTHVYPRPHHHQHPAHVQGAMNPQKPPGGQDSSVSGVVMDGHGLDLLASVVSRGMHAVITTGDYHPEA